MYVGFRLQMKYQVVGTGVYIVYNHFSRVGNHEMHIKDQGGMGAQISNYLWAEAKIGNKMAVHNIEMNPFCPGMLNGLQTFLKRGKIGRKY